MLVYLELCSCCWMVQCSILCLRQIWGKSCWKRKKVGRTSRQPRYFFSLYLGGREGGAQFDDVVGSQEKNVWGRIGCVWG